MATDKKKDAGKGKDEGKTPVIPSDEEIEESLEQLALTREELLELNLHEGRVQLQMNVREKFELKEKVLQRTYLDERDVIRKKQVEAVASMEEAKRDYNDAIKRINERLGINMADYAVREDGVLTLANEEAGSEEDPPKE